MATPAPDAVKRLVDRFDLGRKVFLSGDSEEEQLSKAETPHEAEAPQRQIAATDGQTDTLVCKLYDLTEDEIRVVEGAANG